MFRKTTLQIFLVIFFFLVAGIACDKWGGNEIKTASTKEKIIICQWGQALIYLPLYIAKHKFFAEEGLEVTIINGGGDDLTWTAVASGNAQFGVADPVMVAISEERKGVPGVVVGSIVSRVAFWGVSFDPQVPIIKSPEGFKGSTIALFKFPNTAHAIALKMLKDGNLKPGEDVKLIPVNYEAVIAQLKRKEANIAMVLEPAASLIEHEGARIIYSYPSNFGNFAFTGLTTTKKYATENGATVQKVVNSLEKALNYVRNDFSGSVDIAQKEFPGIPREVLENAVRRMLKDKTIPQHINTDPEGWQKALTVAKDVGKLTTVYPTERLVDNSYAIKAIGKATPSLK